MVEKILISSNDSILISQVCSILEDNDIKYLSRTQGAGQYIKIAYGQTTEETEIVVNEEDFEKSKNLISFLLNEDEKSEDTEITDEEQEDIEKYNRIAKWGIIAFIIIPTLFVMLFIIFSFIITNL